MKEVQLHSWAKFLMAIPSTMTSRFTLSPEAMPPEAVVFGRSDVMRTVRSTLQKGASANVPMLLQGEGGTGKDVLADRKSVV